MTAKNIVSGTRSPKVAIAVRRQWLAMFADTTHMQVFPGRKTAVAMRHRLRASCNMGFTSSVYSEPRPKGIKEVDPLSQELDGRVRQ